MGTVDKLQRLSAEPRHVVAICGGAVSGAEAAAVCAARGIAAIVIEQNPRPYGKIEDGLPRWHDKLRAQEYARINENLAHELIYFVPETRIGRDLDFAEVAREWGVSALLMANGAWRDRPLPMEDAERFVGKGLIYQNAFVHWFNHYEEPNYDGPRYEVVDEAMVIGGGLASVDVAKILNLELYRRALRDKGHEVDIVAMEHKGITATCKKLEVDPDALGVKGCTLYYRRRVKDMPVAFPKSGATEEQLRKTEAVREKMIGILRDKFRIRVIDCHVPVGPVEEDGQLLGLRFRKTEVKDGRAVEVEGSDVEVRSGLIISSIGSVPERIEGIPSKGELYDYTNWDTGTLRGLAGVFGLGNVLTGKGNIKDSRSNSREVSELVVADYLGLGESRDSDLMEGAHAAAQARAEELAESAIRRAKVSREKLEVIAAAIGKRWEAAGYEGDYGAWIDAHRPAS
ncbi:MAG: hypothetical protein OEZ06_29445 [Myxococcales bacterium]|nr:hypothetical protein [Myxococcales bacterium]